MKLSREQLTHLSKVSMEAARQAARLIADYADKDLKVDRKPGGEGLASQVVTEADRMSQELIVQRLKPSIREYDLGLLTEESEDDGSRFHKDYFWCIDPLDGTLPFTRKQEGYAVSIALVSREGVPQIGIVVNPVDHTMYYAIRGEGAYKSTEKEEGTEDPKKMTELSHTENNFTLVYDWSFIEHEYFEHTIDFFKKKISEWGYDSLNIIDTGGAAMNACRVLEHAPACYFKYPKKTEGGGSLWDYAATVCIYNELDAIVCDILAGPLNLNQKSVYMNEKGVVYCTEEKILEGVRELNREVE